MDQTPIKVLVVDDDADDYFITSDVLEDVKVQRYEVDWLSTYDEALEAIGTEKYDVCLVDYHLGEQNGLELIQEAISAGCRVPLILLTGQGDHDLDVLAMRAGAADYLAKGRIDADLLERSLRYSIDRKRAEEEVRKSEEEKLEREHKHLVEQLQHSQKLESIGRLVGGVAHDFNNLLTAIQAYAQLSLMDVPTENARLHNRITEIDNAVKRAANLTGQLLLFSRKHSVEPRPFDLNDMVVDMSKLLRRLIGEHIELVMVLESEPGYILADRGRMEQVLTNLSVNARDAMSDGGKLLIETASIVIGPEGHPEFPSALANEYMLLSVTDTGSGMDEETKSRVFEPFFTTKPEGKGTGLGLSTSYEIIVQCGGEVYIATEIGRGTTFKVLLPKVEQPVEEPDVKEEFSELPQGDETILLAEDDPMLQELFSNVLRSAGYRVYEAGNGVEAMRIAQERFDEQIHLLCTDVVMPLMGGKELATKFKAVHPETKVLYNSGYNDDSIAWHGITEEASQFLSKPFSLAMLAGKVRDTLDDIHSCAEWEIATETDGVANAPTNGHPS